MTTNDFEKAIEALGVQELEVIRFSYGINGQVVAVYGRMGETVWLKWDDSGRGFRFDQPEDMEGCISTSHVHYLDYRRDQAFDLKFE